MSQLRRWISDEECNNCMECSTQFNFLVRKHHCRKCGCLFCDRCSSKRMLIPRHLIIIPPKDQLAPIPGWSIEDIINQPQRCCNSCASSLTDIQHELRNLLSNANKETIVERVAFERYLNSPYTMSLESEIRKACYTLFNFTDDNAIEGRDSIPLDLLRNCRGLVFLTIVKAGFFFTGRLGTGLVLRRLSADSWSAPSAIAMSGAGWGFQVGGEVTDLMIVLNTDHAVDVFTSKTQASLGTALGLSIGPVGRSAGTELHAGDTGVTAAFSYAHSKGLFVGVSLEATLMATRSSVNRAFYGESVDPSVLLSGQYPRPKGAEALYSALNEVIQSSHRHRHPLRPVPRDVVVEPTRAVAEAAEDESVRDTDLSDNLSEVIPVARYRDRSADSPSPQLGPSVTSLSDSLLSAISTGSQSIDTWSRERRKRLQSRSVEEVFGRQFQGAGVGGQDTSLRYEELSELRPVQSRHHIYPYPDDEQSV